VTKNYYRRGGAVSRNGYKKNMSRLGFAHGGVVGHPIVDSLQIIREGVQNYDFSPKVDGYHTAFLSRFFGTGKTRNDFYKAALKKATTKDEKNAIKNDPQWKEPIEEWTVNMLTEQIDGATNFLNKNPNNKDAADRALKFLFKGGTILKFPQKLQDIFINNISSGYKKEFNQPIDSKMLRDVLGTPNKEGYINPAQVDEQIDEIQAYTDIVSADDVQKKEKTPWTSNIINKGLDFIIGKAHASDVDVTDSSSLLNPNDQNRQKFKDWMGMDGLLTPYVQSSSGYGRRTRAEEARIKAEAKAKENRRIESERLAKIAAAAEEKRLADAAAVEEARRIVRENARREQVSAEEVAAAKAAKEAREAEEREQAREDATHVIPTPPPISGPVGGPIPSTGGGTSGLPPGGPHGTTSLLSTTASGPPAGGPHGTTSLLSSTTSSGPAGGPPPQTTTKAKTTTKTNVNKSKTIASSTKTGVGGNNPRKNYGVTGNLVTGGR